MRTTGRGVCGLTLALIFLPGFSCSAPERASAAEPRDGKVYTNRDLPPLTPEERRAEQRRAAQARQLPAPSIPEAPVAGTVAAAHQRVDELRADVATLEARLLAVKNPFLPRPQLPPAEAEAWSGLDNVQREARVERQLEDARIALSAALARLDELVRSSPRGPSSAAAEAEPSEPSPRAAGSSGNDV